MDPKQFEEFYSELEQQISLSLRQGRKFPKSEMERLLKEHKVSDITTVTSFAVINRYYDYSALLSLFKCFDVLTLAISIQVSISEDNVNTIRLTQLAIPLVGLLGCYAYLENKIRNSYWDSDKKNKLNEFVDIIDYFKVNRANFSKLKFEAFIKGLPEHQEKFRHSRVWVAWRDNLVSLTEQQLYVSLMLTEGVLTNGFPTNGNPIIVTAHKKAS